MAERRRKLTIGLPVFNGERYLEQSIVSLLEQTFDDFELIISDNASTDATPEIVASLQSTDSRIVSVRHPKNRGAIWNFNTTFRMSGSPYFKWTAADDFHAPTYLERCIEVLERNPDLVWAHTVSRHVDQHGSVLSPESRFRISYPLRQSPRAVERFESVLLGGSCLDSYGVIRASALRRTPMLVPLFGSEKLLFAELALIGGYGEVHEELFFSRLHDSMAGVLNSCESQHQFTAASGRTPKFIRLRLLAGYLSVIGRSGLSTRDRLHAYRKVAKYVFQIQKWKRVLLGDLTGKGTGGNVRIAT
ncbi:MAG: glycosyltransferase family 2 protein [Planctomycetota bacterium]